MPNLSASSPSINSTRLLKSSTLNKAQVIFEEETGHLESYNIELLRDLRYIVAKLRTSKDLSYPYLIKSIKRNIYFIEEPGVSSFKNKTEAFIKMMEQSRFTYVVRQRQHTTNEQEVTTADRGLSNVSVSEDSLGVLTNFKSADEELLKDLTDTTHLTAGEVSIAMREISDLFEVANSSTSAPTSLTLADEQLLRELTDTSHLNEEEVNIAMQEFSDIFENDNYSDKKSHEPELQASIKPATASQAGMFRKRNNTSAQSKELQYTINSKAHVVFEAETGQLILSNRSLFKNLRAEVARLRNSEDFSYPYLIKFNNTQQVYYFIEEKGVSSFKNTTDAFIHMMNQTNLTYKVSHRQQIISEEKIDIDNLTDSKSAIEDSEENNPKRHKI
ncbi:Uncharacterised protein [Legionella beliardensis]|uniref:Uncharacterized protein n=1 Tax=Legionella beliardensis TaxID=91822 RepID=A0A378I3G3_9GAMM|nr:hypothetical protein [Legionella beliardensis]STX29226.1 Uncharacterised protein [Legionella beliardensis]